MQMFGYIVTSIFVCLQMTLPHYHYCVNSHRWIYIYMDIHGYIWIYMWIYINMDINMDIYMDIYGYIWIYIYIYICWSGLFHKGSWPLSWSQCVKMDLHVFYNPPIFMASQKITHWGRDEMDAIWQTTFSSAFSWMKMFEFRLKLHWSLFLMVQLTIFHHWFR